MDMKRKILSKEGPKVQNGSLPEVQAPLGWQWVSASSQTAGGESSTLTTGCMCDPGQFLNLFEPWSVPFCEWGNDGSLQAIK